MLLTAVIGLFLSNECSGSLDRGQEPVDRCDFVSEDRIGNPDGGAVRRIGEVRDSVDQKGDVEAGLEHMPSCAFDAGLRRQAREDHLLDAVGAELFFEPRAVEGIKHVMAADDNVALTRLERRIEIGAITPDQNTLLSMPY